MAGLIDGDLIIVRFSRANCSAAAGYHAFRRVDPPSEWARRPGPPALNTVMNDTPKTPQEVPFRRRGGAESHGAESHEQDT
jgi:hypothetical protein